MKPLSFVEPLQLAIAENATTPVPSASGVEIWSTAANKKLQWNGTAWVSVTGQAVTGIQTMATPEDATQNGKYVQIAPQGALDPSLLTINHLKLKKNWIDTSALGGINTTGTLFNAAIAHKVFLASYQKESTYGQLEPQYYQPAFFATRARRWEAQFGTTNPATWCFSPTIQGTAVARNYLYNGGGTPYTMMPRIGYTTTAAANSSAGVRDGNSQYVRIKNQAGAGGVFMYVRLNLLSLPSGSRFFCGFSSAGLGAYQDPSTMSNFFGLGCDASDANMSLMTRSTGTVDKYDLSTSKSGFVSAAAVWDIAMWLPRSNSDIWSFSWKYAGGSPFSGYNRLTGALAAAGTTLYPEITINTGSYTSAITVDIHSIYVETDF